MADVEVFKDIPGYKAILKAVLKNQIQFLVEQLSETTGEESLILTASISDGSFSHLGSQRGKVFLQKYENLKSQFLGFCLTDNHSIASSEVTFDEQYPAVTQSYNARLPVSSPNLATDQLSYEINHTDFRNEKPVKKKKRKSGQHSQNKNLTKVQKTSQEMAFREDNNIKPVSLFVKREPGTEADAVDTESDSGTVEYSSQAPGQTKGGTDQMVVDSDSGVDYREGNVGQGQDLFHTTGNYRSTEHLKYNGVTVNNTLDLSKCKTEDPSETDSQQTDVNSAHKLHTSGKPDWGVDPSLNELNSLASQVQALESELHSDSLRDRFLDSPAFSCSICLKGFNLESDFNYHERTYHKLKKYTCDLCQKGFTRRFNMITHRQLHFEVRQHNCKFCSKGYTRRDRLLMHYQSAHGAELGISVENMASTEQQDSSATSL